MSSLGLIDAEHARCGGEELFAKLNSDNCIFGCNHRITEGYMGLSHYVRTYVVPYIQGTDLTRYPSDNARKGMLLNLTVFMPRSEVSKFPL